MSIYCMEFTNNEIKQHFVEYINEILSYKIDIQFFASTYERIDISGNDSVDTIAIEDGDLMIQFAKSRTSLFIFNEEVMFIDEEAKRYSYTTSDIYGNAVYEHNLRELDHKQQLNMFAEILLCFVNASGIEIHERAITGDVKNNYYYISELKEYVLEAKNTSAGKRTKTFGNITINY
ncbi:MAG: hypothetical protein IJA01_06555 [Firmicutes bacterium]|nr:hypothetical protein [Bacillota bacterium]